MSTEDEDDKQYQPTPQKLREARRRGDVPHSSELVSAAVLAAFLIGASVLGPAALDEFGTRAVSMLALGPDHALSAALSASAAFLPVFALAAVAALAAYGAQGAIVLAPDRIAPKLSRIDPLSNGRRRFGTQGAFEFVKTLVKLLLFSGALGFFVWLRLPDTLALIGADPGIAAAALAADLRDFLVIAALVLVLTGAADFLWQQLDHVRRNRMTRQELMDEFRQSEGDPHLKQARRAMAQAIANNRMMSDVSKADVVIVNPTHFAVALRWKRGSRGAPVCVAKGVDHVAARIREAAAIAGVPMRSDPPVARALYASLKVGQEIRPEHYAPVAAAIRFADAMRRRARGRR
ncbi:flagellar type III secretion system protein FlhB [Defluviimonas sp. WL0002]|uniref:Flagellar type III secretion system protein FlhB n=1 Tax=Albidovulum marisflavi TaxID=2984159 RepID=A0ABT2Z7H3_9RHOB|nr:flagellar type III secretion system protein FlhB [Defluviimonas sp. WL0002]MCV2867084.1 flagellar type III secretion system protein FlhB [Defluviimonas sp. WL0002]